MINIIKQSLNLSGALYGRAALGIKNLPPCGPDTHEAVVIHKQSVN